jgi:hypothetical protein
MIFKLRTGVMTETAQQERGSEERRIAPGHVVRLPPNTVKTMKVL